MIRLVTLVTLALTACGGEIVPVAPGEPPVQSMCLEGTQCVAFMTDGPMLGSCACVGQDCSCTGTQAVHCGEALMFYTTPGGGSANCGPGAPPTSLYCVESCAPSPGCSPGGWAYQVDSDAASWTVGAACHVRQDGCDGTVNVGPVDIAQVEVPSCRD